MKATFAAFAALCLLSAPLQANEVDELSANAEQNAQWHCSAYPPGGHHHSHDAYDIHYSHAYWRAKQSCERFHGYGRCHVHCHWDW